MNTKLKSLLLCSISFVSLASFVTAKADINSSGLQMSVYAGVAKSRVHAGTLNLVGETDYLHSQNSAGQQNNFTWGIGAAYRFVLPQAYVLHDISAGLDFYYFKTTQRGTTWQSNNPEQINYLYKLPVRSARLMLDSEWTFHPLIKQRLFPFIEAGVGVAANSMSYKDTPVEGLIGDGNTELYGHSTYQFAYAAGVGTKVLLTPYLNLSLRYLYSNLGNAYTARRGNIPVMSRMKAAVSVQSWLLGLTYSF